MTFWRPSAKRSPLASASSSRWSRSTVSSGRGRRAGRAPGRRSAPRVPPRRVARAAGRGRATATRATTRARKPAAGGRRGRPRGSGTRALQTLELVKAKPGITIPEIASAMGIKQNYLYRVLPGLEKDGKVVKRDRGWHAPSSK